MDFWKMLNAIVLNLGLRFKQIPIITITRFFFKSLTGYLVDIW